MLHLHLGPYHVLINSENFGREVNSLVSSGREFQILGSSVLRIFLPNVVIFAIYPFNNKEGEFKLKKRPF